MFRQVFWTSKKDTIIAELQQRIVRLTAQNTALAEEKHALQAREIELERKVDAAYDALVQEKRVREAAEQEASERFATIAQLRLVMQAQTETLEHDTEMQRNTNDAAKVLVEENASLDAEVESLVERLAVSEQSFQNARIAFKVRSDAYHAAIDENHRLVAREAELVAFLTSIDKRMLRLDRGGTAFLAQRDALVRKEGIAEEPTLVDCPHCHGAHYAGQVCPLAPEK